MRQTIDPTVEYNRGPVLWAAITTFAIGVVVNFVIFRPNLLVPGAVVAGGVAALRSDYYEPSTSNGVVGVLLGVLCLTPLLVLSRVTYGFGVEGAGDVAFVSGAFSAAWLVVALIIMLPLAVIGALVVDFLRRRAGGPIGYDTRN